MNAMWHLVWPAVAFAAVLFAALVVRSLLKRVLRRRMRAPDALAAFLKAVRVPSLLWAAVVALWLAIEVSELPRRDRKSTRLNSSHTVISYAVFCLKKKKKTKNIRLSSEPTTTESHSAIRISIV